MTSAEIHFVVDGQPIPKQSFRAVRGGGYTSPRVKAHQRRVAEYAMLAMVGRNPIQGPVEVRYNFYCGDNRHRDFENLAKLVSDALNKIVWLDDSQVVDARICKYLDKDNPRTEIWVTECGG